MPSQDSVDNSDNGVVEPLWHSIPLENVFSNLDSSIDGLSTEEVINRREK